MGIFNLRDTWQFLLENFFLFNVCGGGVKACTIGMRVCEINDAKVGECGGNRAGLTERSEGLVGYTGGGLKV